MSDQTVAQHQQAGESDPALEHGASDRTYVNVAIFLAVMTALEVAVSYTKDLVGPAHDPLLLFLMAIKFVCVVLYFMHLKYDPAMCKRVFYSGLGVATLVYIAMLATFHYWAPGFR